MAIGVFIFEAVPFILEDLPADRTAPGIGDGETVVPDLGQHHSSVAGVVANLLAMRHAVRERLKPPKPCRADAAKATYYPAHGQCRNRIRKPSDAALTPGLRIGGFGATTHGLAR